MGGSTPLNPDEITLSLEKLNYWEYHNREIGQIVTGAGTILESFNRELEEDQFVTPYNLGAKGSCTVGGNVATLAGGINFIHYGSLRNYIQGLKVVTGDGRLLDMMRWNLKDNTGIDLKQLFIGSEGQLGVITEVRMQVQRLKRSR